MENFIGMYYHEVIWANMYELLVRLCRKVNKMKKTKIYALLCVATLLLTACGSSTSTSQRSSASTSQENVASVEEATTSSNEENAQASVEETEEVVEEVAEETPSGLAFPDTVPEPYVYEGSGDSVIEIEHPEGIYVLYVKGNSDSRHFAVKGYDEDSNNTELFVNTTDPYEGVTIDPDQETVMLEINASGAWVVEVRSIWSCDAISDSTPYTGTGDNIVLVNTKAKMAEIEGNKQE